MPKSEYEIIEVFEITISGKMKGCSNFSGTVFALARTQLTAQEMAMAYMKKQWPGFDPRTAKVRFAIERLLFDHEGLTPQVEDKKDA
jgi:hypothetical protein